MPSKGPRRTMNGAFGRRLLILFSVAVTVSIALALIRIRDHSGSEPIPAAPETSDARQRSAVSVQRAVPASTRDHPTPPNDPSVISFAHTEGTAEIVRAVEEVLGPGHAAACIRHTPDGARQVCVLVDDVGPRVSLDRGWELKDFPGLCEARFEVASGPFARKFGIYTHYVRKGMNYDRQRGDRIAILSLPKDRWPELNLRWPTRKSVEEPSF